MILSHLLLQRSSSIGSLQGRKVQNLADVKPAGTNWNYLGKNKRIPNSQCQWRGHGELLALSLFGPTFRYPTNAENNFYHTIFPSCSDQKPMGFPHIFGREVCDRDRSPPKQRSLALPDPLDPVSLWLWRSPPVARQRGWWKDIEHVGTKQGRSSTMSNISERMYYTIYYILLYIYIYIDMYITY